MLFFKRRTIGFYKKCIHIHHMSQQNIALVKSFYKAFSEKNPKEMITYYHENMVYENPIITRLEGRMAGNYWGMLIEREGEHLKVSASNIRADGDKVIADSKASYLWGDARRQVNNVGYAVFQFKDGKIIHQKDHYDFWKWSRMALGFPGYILGWSSFLNGKVRDTAFKMLKEYDAKTYPNS